jgi:phosphatidylserine/phosphatidylglycerophosphate/cardiolipin synthase-like enzyme
MIVDGAVVITGSFNFTAAAQNRNAENLLVISDPTIAAQYRDNWRRRQGVSMRFGRAAEEQSG